MTTKFTILFNGTARQGGIAFGFSETWYSQNAEDQCVANFRLDGLRERLALLPAAVKIIGYRVGQVPQVGVPTRAFTVSERQGAAGAMQGVPNVPNDSALCQVFGTVGGTIKRFWIHCLPDIAVADADFVAAEDIPGKARSFLNSMRGSGFQFRYTVQNAATALVNAIDAMGNVTLNAAVAGAAPGATVQMLRVRDTSGKSVKGRFRIDTAGYTDTSHFRLLKWTGQVVAVSGQCRIVSYAYTSFQPIPGQGNKADPTVRPGVRKPGRPFGLLRGRAPARR
jgi:hypothetical protein